MEGGGCGHQYNSCSSCSHLGLKRQLHGVERLLLKPYSCLCFSLHLGQPCGPTPLANSCNEPCVLQCQNSNVVIEPPAVVVTLPGPILQSFPQNTAVGSSTSAAVGSILSSQGVPINSGALASLAWQWPLWHEVLPLLKLLVMALGKGPGHPGWSHPGDTALACFSRWAEHPSSPGRNTGPAWLSGSTAHPCLCPLFLSSMLSRGRDVGQGCFWEGVFGSGFALVVSPGWHWVCSVCTE
uniref:Keratin n=1 Tax=Malurus cyaneus samueli TaxID=2593467 RepID=A0A8C5UD51_9PASS